VLFVKSTPGLRKSSMNKSVVTKKPWRSSHKTGKAFFVCSEAKASAASVHGSACPSSPGWTPDRRSRPPPSSHPSQGRAAPGAAFSRARALQAFVAVAHAFVLGLAAAPARAGRDLHAVQLAIAVLAMMAAGCDLAVNAGICIDVRHKSTSFPEIVCPKKGGVKDQSLPDFLIALQA